MRIFSFLKFYMVLIAFLFMFYSAYELSLRREIFLFLAVTLLSPNLFKAAVKVRGVKKGDVVLISIKRENVFGSYMQKITATALGSGRVGEVIEIEFDSKIARGEIVNYGGLFFPPEVNLLYYEERSIYEIL